MTTTVLVTGSSGGIGSAIVERLAGEGRYTIGVDVEAPRRARPSQYIDADVTAAGTDERLQKALSGRELWGVVHCAGLYPVIPLDRYSYEAWNHVHDVNVGSAYRLIAGLSDRIADGGRIVMIASGAGHIGSRDAGYSSSKAALLGLMRSLAMQLADRAILVNAVTPGLIATAMSSRMPADRREDHISRTLLKRIGRPDEVAAAVAFLLDERTGYITGASLDVNGGLYLR